MLGYTVRREPLQLGVLRRASRTSAGIPSGASTPRSSCAPSSSRTSRGTAGSASASAGARRRRVESGRRLHRRARAAGLGRGRRSRRCSPRPTRAGFVPHRAVPAQVAVAGPAGLEIPEDALLPEPGTGALLPVGKGKTAKARVTYRVCGLGGSRQHARLGGRRALSVRLRRALERPARAGPARARSGGRGGHRDGAPGARRRPGGEAWTREVRTLQRHHVHLRRAGGRGLPATRPPRTPRSWPRWRRRGAPCPGT